MENNLFRHSFIDKVSEMVSSEGMSAQCRPSEFIACCLINGGNCTKTITATRMSNNPLSNKSQASVVLQGTVLVNTVVWKSWHRILQVFEIKELIWWKWRLN